MKRSNKEFVKEHFPLLISLITLLGVSVYHILMNDLWIDESSSLLTSEVSIREVITQALVWEEQAPFYYLALTIWRFISQHYVFARFFSLIFMSLSIILIYFYIKKYINSRVILYLILLLITINHNSIYSAVTIRYYSLAIFLSVLLTTLFLNHYLHEEKPSTKHRLLFIVIATIAILTQYYLGFLLLSFGVVILLRKGFKRFMHYCIDMILPIAFVIGQYLLIMSQLETYASYEMQGQTIRGLVKFIFVKVEDYFVAFYMFPDLVWLRYIVRFFYLIVILLGIRNYKKLNAEFGNLLLLVGITFIPFSVLYFIIGCDFVSFRHTLFLYFPMMLIFIFFIKSLKMNVQLWIISVLLVFNIISEIHYASKPASIKQINRYLNIVESENEPIFIYPNEQKHNLQYQYSGINKLVSVPFNIDCSEGYHINHWVLKDTEQLDSVFSMNLKNGINNFFLIEEEHFMYLNIDFKFDVLNNYLNRKYKCELDTTFNAYRLMKFSVKD